MQYSISRAVKIVAACTLSTAVLMPAAQAQVSERTLKAAASVPADHPVVVGLKKFSDIVNKNSGGKIKIRVYPNAQLGNDLQAQSALQGGTLDFFLGATTTLGGIVKDFGVYDFPFLFNKPEEADAVLDGPFGKKLEAKLPEKGLVSLGYWENGYRNVTNSKHPIVKWEDLGGLKIRTMQSSVLLDVFNNFNANAVPLAFSEVYSALETRAVDAQENPNALIESSKFDDVQKYISLTRHVYNPFILLMSKKSWDKLSADEKRLLGDAATEAKLFERRLSRENDAKALAELKKRGMQANDFSDAERTRMAERTKPIIAKHSTQIGGTVVSELQAEIAKVRAAK
ncbi:MULTISPECIES: TRAP transporter substrate-binding protein [Comamonas]|uniref:TRAP transporter substrate-binding protein n=1 Tax=Comamonas TaxID=283 RepID=UPI0001BB104D|nr:MULTISPECIES: TRAP transporter substrate-binding protein [Comamonas]ACY33843.1 TRAP dicarboxylate transporter, DctP subunit [Comamonas thiooxydans]MBL5979953.1 TRAP transporter substrate-binding protein [Comamonas sp. NyZ500]MDO1475795.1 TRAP transporter substrate-binding protein [Comamonas thiooxydans]